MKLCLVLSSLLSMLSIGQYVANAQDAGPAKPAEKPAAAAPARRTPWTTSKITGSPSPPAPYISERVFPSLTFDQPGEMVVFPGGKRFGLVEVKGKIFSFPATPDAATVETDLFADCAKFHPDFYRVYGLTFHPKFAENRTCYICYVLKSKIEDGSRVSRFKVTDTDPPRLIPESEEVLITWVSGGHNGGHLQFGPDRMLYITTGDGGESFPPDGRNTGQDIGDLLASILRIDVDREEAGRRYAIPKDNPFVGWDHPGKPAPGSPTLPIKPETAKSEAAGKLIPKQAGAPPPPPPRPPRGEVWAYGLRNPWKMCFDPADGSLWTADVGWEMWEMIYRVERGGNYGWSLVEGRQPVHRERLRGPTPIIPPTVEHDHTESRSITGGYFWGSDRLPELKGAYVYGDYVTGKVWALKHEGEKITWKQELVDTPLQIVAFGPSADGEVYLVDWFGTIHRLKANPRRDANAEFPKRLSETGLFQSVAEQIPARGVFPYQINAEPWADGTTAERFVALPQSTQLGVFKKTDVQIGYIAGEWEFPSDGVLVKTVSIELTPGDPKSRRRLETQILHYDVDTWKGYNYLWNDEQTDAVLADAGSDRVLKIADPEAPGGTRRQTWHHASRLECLLCHTTRSGTVQGFRLPQFWHGESGGSKMTRLAPLLEENVFAEPPRDDYKPWANPYDQNADLTERVRSYLHVNCAHCHRRGGGGSAAFDVQHQLPLEKTNLVGSRPTQGTFNIHNAQVVAPGDPYRSVLYYRMAKLGPGHMPQFGANTIDREGLNLIHDWIQSLPGPAVAGSGTYRRIEQFVETPSRALETLAFLERSEGDTIPDRKLVIEAGLKHPDPLVRDLFERYLPEEKRTKRLDASVKAADILAITGDAANGAALFATSAAVQCRNCHKVGSVGRTIGPDLSTIGRKLDRTKLVESILEPSKTIDPQFATYQAETADGRVVSGILVSRSDAEVVLRDVEGKDVKLAAADVEAFTPQQKSLMPELLIKDLTAQQLADLLAYLAGLK
jgi:putative heme-binding domain-containing protein